VACEKRDPLRAEAEDFVRARFLRSHRAHIATFMPTLLLLKDSADSLVAVAGFRRAAGEELFLEQYLQTPIERAIAAQVTAPVKRAEIVEVGNFAALDSRRARVLMSFMPVYFTENAARWIVFTATSAIRGLLASLGGQCLELGSAESRHVSGGADEWGRYYAQDPRVMAGFLPAARRIPALWRSTDGD
jgi:hypothetical protein